MFENDDPVQRERLIKALINDGLDAWELNSGGDTMHVIVTLFDFTVDPSVNTATDLALQAELNNGFRDWPYDGYLYIRFSHRQRSKILNLRSFLSRLTVCGPITLLGLSLRH